MIQTAECSSRRTQHPCFEEDSPGTKGQSTFFHGVPARLCIGIVLISRPSGIICATVKHNSSRFLFHGCVFDSWKA